MGILSWVILGLIAGWLAKFIMPGAGGLGLLHTLVLGIIGAVVGGFVSTALNIGSVNGINLFSIIISVVGAIIAIFIFRLIKKV